MSQASVYKPLKPYTPQNLVKGFVVPVGKGEKLLCSWCASAEQLTGATPISVTFDGRVNCSCCRMVLS